MEHSKMKKAKCILRDMHHNVSEARDKMHKAYRMRGDDKAAADWQRDMAKTHLEYNGKVNDHIAHMLTEAMADEDHIVRGIATAYLDWHGDIMGDAAEVNAMIQAYK